MTQTVKHPVDMAVLTAHYTMKDVESVSRFLEERSAVLPLLLEAPAHIESLFGEQMSLALEITRDLDSPSDSRQLFLLIRTPLELDSALDRLRALDDGWWKTVRAQTEGALMTDVECISGV